MNTISEALKQLQERFDFETRYFIAVDHTSPEQLKYLKADNEEQATYILNRYHVEEVELNTEIHCLIGHNDEIILLREFPNCDSVEDVNQELKAEAQIMFNNEGYAEIDLCGRIPEFETQEQIELFDLQEIIDTSRVDRDSSYKVEFVILTPEDFYTDIAFEDQE